MRVPKLLRFCFTTFALAVLFFGSPGAAFSMSTDAARDSLAKGVPILVSLSDSVGELKRNSKYLVRFDRSASSIIVSELSGRKISAYSYDAKNLSRGVSLWGSPFLWSADTKSGCLTHNTLPNNNCVVRVLGPLLADNLSIKGDLTDIAAKQLIGQLTLHLAHPQAVIDRGGTCPRNSSLNQTHLADRFLADILWFNSGILPYITDLKLRPQAERLIDGATRHLINTARPSSRTTYTDCYGGLDLITTFQVARALDEQYKLNPKPEIRTYLRRLWQNVEAEGATDAFGARNAKGQTNCANCFAAYLHMAVIMESHGIRAWQPYTQTGLDSLLKSQAMENGRTCTDKNGTFIQPYGGWQHSTIECSQNLGYHNFITGALIAAHEHLKRSGSCNQSGNICSRMEKSLVAGLKWIGGLSSGSVKAELFDRAQGTSNTSSVAGSGNVNGADTGFRIIAYLGNINPPVRIMLVQALEESMAAKKISYSPVSSYYRSVAFGIYKD